jgi:hypothetical protein
VWGGGGYRVGLHLREVLFLLVLLTLTDLLTICTDEPKLDEPRLITRAVLIPIEFVLRELHHLLEVGRGGYRWVEVGRGRKGRVEEGRGG